MKEKNILFLVSFLLLSPYVLAQEGENTDQDSSGVVKNILLPTSTPILLFTVAEDNEEDKKKKKKKKKKNFYYGEKTKRSFIRQAFRDQTHSQYFHYTRNARKVNPYIRDIYWFDRKERVIRTQDFNPSQGFLLHGPYEKRIDDQVVESGMFYYGTKHGRWMSFNIKNILLDKTNFYEGWPEESRITYYNRAEQKIETLIPVAYDLEDGNFYHFYENGQIAVKGEYKYGEKVGLWTAYWNNTGDKVIKKREIQYQEKPFTKDFRPYIKAEWDKEGTPVYRRDS